MSALARAIAKRPKWCGHADLSYTYAHSMIGSGGIWVCDDCLKRYVWRVAR